MYTSQPRQENPSKPLTQNLEITALLDPSLVRAARHIYRTYYEVHPDRSYHRPTGVAIHRFTYRGKLIFYGQPILLPDECFVPIGQIESEMY